MTSQQRADVLLAEYRSERRAFLRDLRHRIAVLQAHLASSDRRHWLSARQYMSIEQLQRKLAELEAACP
jgi:hypothetical protein